MIIQNRYNFFTAGTHAIKKIKILRSCSRFKTISLFQLFSTIEIVSVVVTIEQQTICRNDLLFLFNNLNIVLMNLNSNRFIRVRVLKKYFFEFKFKFEFGKMIEFFRVCSPATHHPNPNHKNYGGEQRWSVTK